MTESDWAECEKPGPMLTFLRGRVGDRNLRLFACACCRSIRHIIPAGPCREVVDTALRFADGRATADDLARARAAAVAAADRDRSRSAAAWAACEAANPSASEAAVAASQWAAEQAYRTGSRAAAEEGRRQAGFFRDIVGDPFRTVPAASLRRAAQSPRVQEIAAELYDGGPQEDMKDLADELERQGCCDPAVLAHCRSDEQHVRGCWVLDRILGPEAGPVRAATPVPPRPAGTVPPERTREIRTALAEFLGPKKYRRTLRLAASMSRPPGVIGRPPVWTEFATRFPQYELSDDELTEVLATCTLHDCGLVDRVVRGAQDAPALLQNKEFLHARGTRFPHSHAEVTDAEWEIRVWVCPECQRLREEWIDAQA